MDKLRRALLRPRACLRMVAAIILSKSANYTAKFLAAICSCYSLISV